MNLVATTEARKMNGAGNAFVLIDERPPLAGDYPALARRLCSAESGFGADGLLVVRDAPQAAAEMRIYNADGSSSEMCGNGMRCVALYLYERGAGERFDVDTLAGSIGCEVLSPSPFVARLALGVPQFPHGTGDATLDLGPAFGAERTWHYAFVTVGNPHAVVFVPEPDAVDVARIGKAISTHARFAEGTNVHFARVVDPHTVAVRHFERGAGMTQACGTGAVAVAALAIARDLVDSPVCVRVPGGMLEVAWTAGGSALLSGPAVTEFTRTIAL